MKRGTDASLYHHLVMAIPKLHLKRCPVQKKTRACYNTNHLMDRGMVDRFHLNLTNRFQTLHELYEDSNTDPEVKLEHAKQMWTSTCEVAYSSRIAS